MSGHIGNLARSLRFVGLRETWRHFWRGYRQAREECVCNYCKGVGSVGYHGGGPGHIAEVRLCPICEGSGKHD